MKVDLNPTLTPATLTRETLVEAVQPALGGSKAHLRAVLDALLDEMAAALCRGDVIHLRGFGRFWTAATPERLGRNPRTGESCTIPASTRLRFKPSKALMKEAGA